MDDIDSDHLIKALEQIDLPPMPATVQALIDPSPPYLVELLRALADDMEHPGKGAAALAALPPEARIIEQALRDNPALCYTGLLEISKKGSAFGPKPGVLSWRAPMRSGKCCRTTACTESA